MMHSVQTVSWTREGDDWAVRWEGSEYPSGTAAGFVVTVTSRSGRKAEVILGELVRHYLVKGGRHVDIYAVDQDATDAYRQKKLATA